MLKLHILASGSRGNAAVVENAATGRGVLIDCGICKRDFFARCDEAGFDPAKLDAVLITHEHGDHTKGIGVTMRGLAKLGRRPAIYAAPATLQASKHLQDIEETCEIRALAPEALVSAAGMSIVAFATSHDAAASFGFRIEANGDAAGFMTDTGIVTDAAHAHLQDVRLLALESNHDPRMLSEGPYPYVVKRRIASDEGHLSNEQGAEELASLLSTRLEAVAAMHVSKNNNEYDLAKQGFRAVTEREGHPARIACGYQGRLTTLS
ncbi:MAG: MBL fold metallo-hydrolase [Slackia faecicanis]|nr:MBL fold metallo-hydrolase [Slackia faecicanis]